jgi:protein KRI1
MGRVFGQDFYATEETEKPQFEPDEYIDSTEPLGLPKDEVEKLLGKKKTEEEEAEVDPVVQSALESNLVIVGKRLKKKLKQKMTVSGEVSLEEEEEAESEDEGDYEEVDATDEGGQVDPLEAKKKFKEALENYYRLDFEDVVAGIPCRFKYTEVEPDHSGITVKDVLTVDDKELKRVVPLKKLAPYIPKAEQATMRPLKWLPWRRKGYRAGLRVNLTASLFTDGLLVKKIMSSMTERPHKVAKK